ARAEIPSRVALLEVESGRVGRPLVAVDGRPRDDLAAGPLLAFVAAVDHHASEAGSPAASCDQPVERGEAVEEVLGHGLARLRLDSNELVAALEDAIELGTLAVAEEEEVRRQAAVNAGLDDLGGDPRLEDRPAQRSGAELIRTPDAEEVAHQPGVVEVELRRLHETLAHVRVEGGRR